MTPQGNKPSCHDVITGKWTPSDIDKSAGLVPGYGVITNIINGRIECRYKPDTRVEKSDRVLPKARPLAPTSEEDPASWCTKKVKTRDSEAVVIETLKVEEEMYVSPKASYKEKLLSMSGVKGTTPGLETTVPGKIDFQSVKTNSSNKQGLQGPEVPMSDRMD
ncbi:hypothetical protein JHK84_045300 [Glycine max]|nr:hypothetical protein JHK86_045244 [Glycine max]KAG5108393.1 hypothetical protein JHK84_045300 [Glycine max]